LTVLDDSGLDADPTGGEFHLEHLLLGTYTIVETVAPPHDPPYILDPDTESVTLTATNPSNCDGVGNDVIPVFVNTLPPPPGEIRMTGGGSIFLPNFDTRTNDPKVIEGEGFGKERRITHGFELHCSHDGDITTVNNHLEINWGSPDQHFHLLFLTDIECPNDLNIQPPPPPFTLNGPDTLIGVGDGVYSGSFQGKRYSKEPAIITFILTDAGEPGTGDTSSYIITLKKSGIIVLNTGDTNANGARDAADFGTVGTIATFAPIPPTAPGPGKDPSNTGTPDIPDQRFLYKGNHQVHPELKKLTSAQVVLERQITQVFNQLDNVNINDNKLDSLTSQLLTLFSQFEIAGVV